MSDDNPLRPNAEPNQSWDTEAWFFLSLLAVLFWGVAGVAGSAAAFVGLRVLAHKLPRNIVIAIAVVLGALSIVLTKAILSR